MRKKWVILSIVALWGMVTLWGTVVLARYAGTPGDEGTPVAHWPVDTSLVPSEEAFTLVMFLHPLCPCSQASVSELARVLTGIGSRARTIVVFTRPEGVDEYTRDDSLWQRVTALTDVTVLEDTTGGEASRFGAMTSGHTLLFTPSGHRVFSGGITPSRGHEGDNKGSDAIAALVKDAGDKTVSAHTAVFGCSLFERAFSRLVLGWTDT